MIASPPVRLATHSSPSREDGGGSDRARWDCPRCDAVFRTRETWQVHLDHAHGPRPITTGWAFPFNADRRTETQ